MSSKNLHNIKLVASALIDISYHNCSLPQFRPSARRAPNSSSFYLL